MMMEKHASFKHPKPIIPRFLVFLFSTCLLFIIFYAAFTTLFHMKGMYDHSTDPLLQEKNTAILTYLDESLFAQNTLVFLSDAERSHMSDVKQVFDIVFLAYLVALGILLGITAMFMYCKNWPRLDELLTRSFRAVGWIILGMCFFFGVGAFLDFTKLWILFHVFFFPQGNWAFAANSTLITLYPESFFMQFLLFWLLIISVFGVVLVAISYIMKHMKNAEQEFHDKYERRELRRKSSLKR